MDFAGRLFHGLPLLVLRKFMASSYMFLLVILSDGLKIDFYPHDIY